MRSKLMLVILCLQVVLNSCNKNEEKNHVIETGSVIDKNGRVYKTVKIGDDWWMAENLQVTVYNDSTPLARVEPTAPADVWAGMAQGAYSFTVDSVYGLLYNFAAVADARGLAPEGWHIATDADWKNLEESIGMPNDQTDKLGWRGTNEAEKLAPLYSRGWPEFSELFGTDEFGFKALPGGCRLFNGEINLQNNTAFWWTKSAYDNEESWYRYMDYNQDRVFRQHTYKSYGMSVRCVKNK